MARDRLHITVGCVPRENPELDVEEHIVKAALLYADHVRLCSANAALVQEHVKLKDLKVSQQVATLERIIPANEQLSYEQRAGVLSELGRYKQLVSRKNPTKDDLLERGRLQTRLDIAWQRMRDHSEAVADGSGARDLLRAIDDGLVELHRFEKTEPSDRVQEFIEELRKSTSSAATYPMFDASTSEYVRTLVTARQLTVEQVNIGRGKQVALAARLFERLPSFEFATLEQVLWVRRELRAPLINFRAKIIDFAKQVESASWDEEFEYYVEEILRHEVEPAVLAIEQAVESNTYLRELVRLAFDKPIPASASGSVVALVVAKMSALPEVAAHGLAAAGATNGVIFAARAYHSRQEKVRETEQNSLYFYYKAGHKLDALRGRKRGAPLRSNRADKT